MQKAGAGPACITIENPIFRFDRNLFFEASSL